MANVANEVFSMNRAITDFVRDDWLMNKKNNDRFNAEMLRMKMEVEDMSQRGLSREIPCAHGTVQNWLRGGLPGKEKLNRLGEIFGVDPMDFLADPYDMLHSYSMGFAFKIFEWERRGQYDVKITLTGLVRLLKELKVFEDPLDSEVDLPESLVQKLMPELEERARREQEVMELADENMLRNLVAAHGDKLRELLDDEDNTPGDEGEEPGDKVGDYGYVVS